jgi:hypothetical protein
MCRPTWNLATQVNVVDDEWCLLVFTIVRNRGAEAWKGVGTQAADPQQSRTTNGKHIMFNFQRSYRLRNKLLGPDASSFPPETTGCHAHFRGIGKLLPVPELLPRI